MFSLEDLQILKHRGFILALVYPLFPRRKRPKYPTMMENLSTLTSYPSISSPLQPVYSWPLEHTLMLSPTPHVFVLVLLPPPASLLSQSKSPPELLPALHICRAPAPVPSPQRSPSPWRVLWRPQQWAPEVSRPVQGTCFKDRISLHSLERPC